MPLRNGSKPNHLWTNLYYGYLQASLLRMDLTPNFKSPYSDNSCNSPSYGNPGPGGNFVRTFTNATTYTNLSNGSQAQIAVLGPNIDSNIACFNITVNDSGQQVAGVTAELGQSRDHEPGDFKLFASLWSPMPWVKVTDANTYQSGGANPPANGTPFPFIWLGNFAGGSLDVFGTPRPEFNDSALGPAEFFRLTAWLGFRGLNEAVHGELILMERLGE